MWGWNDLYKFFHGVAMSGLLCRYMFGVNKLTLVVRSSVSMI